MRVEADGQELFNVIIQRVQGYQKILMAMPVVICFRLLIYIQNL